MTERDPDDITLVTLHEDLTDLKATLIAGFHSLPTRESSEEMVRLLREGNRLNEERFTQLDLRLREQHRETQQVLHAVAEGQRQLVEGQRQLVEGQRQLVDGQRQLLEAQRLLLDGQRSLSADIKALIARLDALIRDRDNGEPAA